VAVALWNNAAYQGLLAALGLTRADRFVSGPDAVLADGLKPGAGIVTDGAAELFGTEFGFGK
jgi:hypothetical protein